MTNSEFKPGEKVELEILRKTNLGFLAKINSAEEGLLYNSEIFQSLETGQHIDGYINKVREDGLIDLLLQPLGRSGVQQLSDEIVQTLTEKKGFMPINAKSPAEDIYDVFGVSRKKFKMALGNLYKQQIIKFTDAGTVLVSFTKR